MLVWEQDLMKRMFLEYDNINQKKKEKQLMWSPDSKLVQFGATSWIDGVFVHNLLGLFFISC